MGTTQPCWECGKKLEIGTICCSRQTNRKNSLLPSTLPLVALFWPAVREDLELADSQPWHESQSQGGRWALKQYLPSLAGVVKMGTVCQPRRYVQLWVIIFKKLFGHKAHGILVPHCCCSVNKSCLTLFDPIDFSTPGFPVLHHLLQFAQTHVH